MTEAEILEQHLKYQEPDQTSRFRYFSSLTAAVRDARHATRRELDTGQKIPGESHGSWLGALGYFTVLDQIGTCFREKDKSRISSKGVVAALEHFTELNQSVANALYALRCSFAHDFSLFNFNKNKANLCHRFLVVADSETPLVVAAKRTWNGDPFDDSPEVFTLINLEAFGDLAEAIYNRLLQLAESKRLEINLKYGSRELAAKYAFAIFKWK